MAAAGPVDPTAPRPPRVSLLTSANVREDGSDTEQLANDPDTRWIDGFAYTPEPCDAGGIIDPCGDDSTAAETNEDTITVTPFVVEAAYNCSVFSQGRDARRNARQTLTRALLIACQAKLLERELWSGTLTEAAGTGNKYLTDGDAVLPEGTKPLGYVTALAVLEHAIADGLCGDRAMIHARADTVTFWVRDGLVDRVGNLLVTKLDTIVVPGRGYSGSLTGGPTLSTDGAWAFATSLVEARLGRIDDAEPLIDRTTGAGSGTTANNLTYRAQRPAAVTWGCLHVGVHVLHTEATTVSGS